jgi:hypothetical protein
MAEKKLLSRMSQAGRRALPYASKFVNLPISSTVFG